MHLIPDLMISSSYVHLVCLLSSPQPGSFLHLLLRNPPDWDGKRTLLSASHYPNQRSWTRCLVTFGYLFHTRPLFDRLKLPFSRLADCFCILIPRDWLKANYVHLVRITAGLRQEPSAPTQTVNFSISLWTLFRRTLNRRPISEYRDLGWRFLGEFRIDPQYCSKPKNPRDDSNSPLKLFQLKMDT
jgi:hypothetical protein